MNKKIKSITKKTVKQTRIIIKKADKKAGKLVKAFKKEWKKEAPKREQYKNEIKKAANKAGKRGLKLLNEGIENGMKIGGDVVETIRKDINEIQDRKKNK